MGCRKHHNLDARCVAQSEKPRRATRRIESEFARRPGTSECRPCGPAQYGIQAVDLAPRHQAPHPKAGVRPHDARESGRFVFVAQRLRDREACGAERRQERADDAVNIVNAAAIMANDVGKCASSRHASTAGSCTSSQKNPSANPVTIARTSPRNHIRSPRT